MTMSSVMFIKKLLRKGSRAGCVSREGQRRTVMMAEKRHTAHDVERQNVSISKKEDDQTFGFHIRTYENTTDSELFTCVCSVKENSPADSAGLRTGDVIISINRVCVEGFEHQQIVDLVQTGSCMLEMEIVRGTSIKRTELQKKLEHLQRQLREKRSELQMLITQEERLRRGERCTQPRSCLISEEAVLSSSVLLQT